MPLSSSGPGRQVFILKTGVRLPVGAPIYNKLRISQKFMEKRVIIIHGCPSSTEKAMSPETRTYDKHWIPWLKRELAKREIQTETPLMPTPWEPDYEKFKAEFEKCEVGENTILIGHSCGSAFLVRWLGETKKKIFKLILVAPWKIPDKNDGFGKTFYIYPIDESIKSRVGEIVVFTAGNEEADGKESLKIFHKALGGEIIDLKGHGHYTIDDMGTEKFPELLEIVLK
jgi:predicted alpha/beta hydrolase family esterase